MPDGNWEKIKRAVDAYQDWEGSDREKFLEKAEKLASRSPDYRKEGEEPPEALKRAQFDDLRWKAGELGSQYGDVKAMQVGGEDYLPKNPDVYLKTAPRKRRAYKR